MAVNKDRSLVNEILGMVGKDCFSFEPQDRPKVTVPVLFDRKHLRMDCFVGELGYDYDSGVSVRFEDSDGRKVFTEVSDGYRSLRMLSTSELESLKSMVSRYRQFSLDRAANLSEIRSSVVGHGWSLEIDSSQRPVVLCDLSRDGSRSPHEVLGVFVPELSVGSVDPQYFYRVKGSQGERNGLLSELSSKSVDSVCRAVRNTLSLTEKSSKVNQVRM